MLVKLTKNFEYAAPDIHAYNRGKPNAYRQGITSYKAGKMCDEQNCRKQLSLPTMKNVILSLMAACITAAGCATSKTADTSGPGNTAVGSETAKGKVPGKPINTKAPASGGANAVNNYPTAAE